MQFPQFVLRLPDWVGPFLAGRAPVYPTVEERMRLTIELARMNVQTGTGGPFGAAVFNQESGELVAPGVNLVVATNCSVVHAEIVATILAQQKVGTFDLGGEGLPPFELVSSAEPCAMCLGAIPWSGIRQVVLGARDEDIRRIGFDEGHKPPDWVQGLESRGIRVVRDVCREEAAAVLEEYVRTGGLLYNARRGDPSS